jgi:hypothetical protein
VVFRVPRFGLWSGLTIKIGINVKCIANAGATTSKAFSNWLGLFLMKSVVLSTHNKVICTIPAEALLFESTYARDANTRHTLGYLECNLSISCVLGMYRSGLRLLLKIVTGKHRQNSTIYIVITGLD